MLKALTIENFKGIHHGTLTDLAQVNVLVGRNNSGKSTVLEALVLSKLSITRDDLLGHRGIEYFLLDRHVERQTSGVSELWPQQATSNPIAVHFVYETNERHMFAHFQSAGILRIVWTNSPDSKTKEFYKRSSNEDTRIREFLRSDYSSISSSSPGHEMGVPFVTWLALLHLLDPQMRREHVAEVIWGDLTRDRTDKRLVDIINQVYGLNIENLTFVPSGGTQRLVALLPEHSLPLDWLGDGLRYAIVVLSLGLLLKDTALLIEELESHQHPEALRLLTNATLKMAKQQNLQLFLTTHSAELINYVIEAAEAEGLDMRIHHLALSRDGELTSRSISEPDARLLSDIGYDIRLHDRYLRKA